MIDVRKFKVRGVDGKEYGPAYADHIYKWIGENRVYEKTPIKPPDAKDWVLLGSLPEFVGALKKAEEERLPKRKHKKRTLAVLLVVLAGVVLWILKQFGPH